MGLPGGRSNPMLVGLRGIQRGYGPTQGVTGMRIKPRKAEDVTVFDLKGDLEGGPDSYALKEAVKEKLAEGERKFLLNMDKVNFVNSTGIGIVATVYTSIANAGGNMKICNANEKVSRVMMVTKLLTVFDSYYQEEEALKAFRSG